METMLCDNHEYKVLDMFRCRFTGPDAYDSVFLTAFENMSGKYMADISVVVRNREGAYRIVPDVSSGAGARLFYRHFTGGPTAELLLCVSAGQGRADGWLYGLREGRAAILFDGGRFAAQNAYAAAYRDFGEAEIIHARTGERHLVFARRKEQDAGDVTKPAARGFRENGAPLCALRPAYDAGAKRWLIEASQRIIGGEGACVAYVHTRLYWNGREMKPYDTCASMRPFA